MKNLIIIIFVFVLLLPTAYGSQLKYEHVYPIMQQYLQYHIKYKVFDQELLTRTAKGFCEALDPIKMYFYKSDVDKFIKNSKNNYRMIKQQLEFGNCSYFKKQFNLYLKRVSNRNKQITNILKNNFKPIDTNSYKNLKFKYATTEVSLNSSLKLILSFRMNSFDDETPKKEKIEKITSRYDHFLKEIKDFKEDDIAGFILKAFGLALDPHTVYFSPDELEDFNISLSLSLEGIGALLRSEDGFTIIEKLIEGGPAKRSKKLKANDKIIGVGQTKINIIDIFDMKLRDVVKKIRGKKGTPVYLKILRENKKKKSKRFIVKIIREKIQLLDQIAKSKVKKVNGKKLGILTIPSFYQDFDAHKNGKNYRSVSKDVKKEIDKLKNEKVDGIIVDLRNNGGGSLEEAVKVAGLFIKSGVVVSVKNSISKKEDLWDNDATEEYNGPLILLINCLSASASEIVSGTLQDYGRAIIVGDKSTFGKGSVQTFFPLKNGLGALKVTISQFYTAGGSSTQEKGVHSDIIIPSETKELEIGEKFYDYPLNWDKIDSSIGRTGILSTLMDIVGKKEKYNDSLKKVFPELKKRSKKRINNNIDFKYIIHPELKKDDNNSKKIKKDKNKDIDEENKKDPVLDEALNILNDLILFKNIAYPVK